MHRFGLIALGLTAALLAVPPVGRAQNVILDAPGLLPTKKKAGLPEVRVAPAAWPRLDPGAVFCRSEADLARLAANRRGGAGGGAADCRIINSPTAIQIVQRLGPGRTQVQISGGTDQSGWTDAWLPDRAPSNVGNAAAR